MLAQRLLAFGGQKKKTDENDKTLCGNKLGNAIALVLIRLGYPTQPSSLFSASTSDTGTFLMTLIFLRLTTGYNRDTNL